MPPRKKATTASTKPASTRTTRASSKAQATASSSQGNSAPKPASKRSRAAAASDSEDAPVSKKAKVDDVAEDEDEDTAQDTKDEPKKMVTILKRGAAPVDPASRFVDSHQVYANEQDVWDAMLNQTDIGNNANKFYVLQLLHPVGNSTQCLLFTRWGRVGENGQQMTKGPWASAQAILEFKKQFKAKAGTAWEQRKGMTAKKGKYMWLERVFEDEDSEEKDDPQGEGSSNKKEKAKEEIPDSALAPELQALCKLIFSTTFIDAALSSMNYDANKLPLGKLAKSTILNGFAALKTLAEVLEEPNSDLIRQHGSLRAACEALSGAYYSIIPHAFGRNRPVTIDSMTTLKKELELVDALGDMEIAQKLITQSILTDDQGNPINPLDAHFRSLGLSFMEPVNRNSTEFKSLEAYARDTHGQTHRHYSVSVMNAFRVERESETAAWLNAGYDKLADGERLLLWHGSRSTNFAGILKQGLRIAPPEAPVTGYMFGKGVYFADMMSKSANYCYAHMSDSTGLLLLCEVAAKPFYEQTTANYNADQGCKSSKKLCTKGIGRTQPVKWKDAGATLDNDALTGCHMPDGPGEDIPSVNGYLQYNEYIAYDASQIRLRYLLMVKMPGAY